MSASRGRPHLVEVTGVAGAGKSTLVETVCRSEAGRRRAGFINARNPADLGRIAVSVPRLLPVLIRNLGRGPRFTWAEFKLLAYATSWRRVFARRPEYAHGVTLLDQGPVYALVRLKALGKRATTSEAFERWWNRTVELWSRELAAVVYLDASDDVLWERINGRPQPHGTKGEPEGVGRAFIARYRQLFDEISARLDRPGGPVILRLDTSEATPEQLAARLEPVLPGARGAGDVAGTEARG
jgi:thymidylate kinase